MINQSLKPINHMFRLINSTPIIVIISGEPTWSFEDSYMTPLNFNINYILVKNALIFENETVQIHILTPFYYIISFFFFFSTLNYTFSIFIQIYLILSFLSIFHFSKKKLYIILILNYYHMICKKKF